MPGFTPPPTTPLNEMTRGELVGSFVFYTVIVAFVDTVTVVESVQRGFSILSAVILIFTSIILALAYRRFLGELSRRRRTRHR